MYNFIITPQLSIPIDSNFLPGKNSQILPQFLLVWFFKDAVVNGDGFVEVVYGDVKLCGHCHIWKWFKINLSFIFHTFR